MKKRALTILLCATLILSLVACGGGQSDSNSTEPPSNSTGGTQQNDEPTTPPPSESDKTPDATEPQDTETTEPSTSDAPVDDVPLYLGGNKEVSPEDFAVVLSNGDGLIEFDNAAVVKDVTLNITAQSFWGLAHPFTITLGTNSTTLGEFLEQYNMANADGTFGDACSTAEDLISNVFYSIWFKYNANTDINNESTTLDDCEALRIFVIDNEGDFGTINGAPIDDNTSSDWRYEKDATDLVNELGVPKYGYYAQNGGFFYGYVWDADEFWLCLEKGKITYIRKGLDITELGDLSNHQISVMLTEIQ